MGLQVISELQLAPGNEAAAGTMQGGAMAPPAKAWDCDYITQGSRAIPTLIAKHRSGLMAFVQARVRPPIDAADIIQEVWTQALPAIEAGQVAHQRAYLYGIARNLTADAMRQQYRRTRWMVEAPSEAAIADEAPSAYRVANAKDQLRTLNRAVGGLPERCREVFELRHVEQLGKAEIADRLGITTKQVEKQLRHALERCRGILVRKNNLQGEGAKRLPSPT
ncbi:MAG: RNA polymerase sigma factor [Hyphomicrobiales bacterium]|nr:MAG: RNA polymerase sigma factor [Hyphomicrobiales bacterium]